MYGTGHDGRAHPSHDGLGSKSSKLSKALFGSSSDWDMSSGGKHGYDDGLGMGSGHGGKTSKSDKKALKMLGKLLSDDGGDAGDGGGDGGGGDGGGG